MRSRNSRKANKSSIKGQALVEYVLIAGLTFIGMVTVAKIFHASMVASNEFHLKTIKTVWLF